MRVPGRGGGIRFPALTGMLVGLLLLAPPVDGVYPQAGFRTVTGPCQFRFPEDHGAHPGFQTEWWYYTGNLETRRGRRFGYQLTFFRRQLAPSQETRSWPEPASAWRTLQVYPVHLAVSDIREKRHYQAETMVRGALGMAGTGPRKGEGVRVFVKGWSAELAPDGHHLKAATPELGLDLALIPLKPPVPHGDGGYSRRGEGPENASCYYSMTRLKTGGWLRIGDHRFEISGFSWMDHEFHTSPLGPDVIGWDWLSLQLDDGTELMAYFLREADNRIHPASGATFVDPEGEGTHVVSSDLMLEATATWKSPATGAVYPAGWKLTVPSLDLTISVSPAFADQEMQTPLTTGVTYWEGAVSLVGRSGGRPVRGSGYAELTGYDRGFDPSR